MTVRGVNAVREVGLSVGVSVVRGVRCDLYQREGVVCYKEETQALLSAPIGYLFTETVRFLFGLSRPFSAWY